MLSFKDYREEATAAPVQAINQTDTIDKLVDAWIYELKKSLIGSATSPENRRGVWDRFKNWMSNMWHGRYDPKNPYSWQNKLGDDLGRQTEAYIPNPNDFNLNEYKEVKQICDSLEKSLNEEEIPGTEKLKMINIINQKAQELKDVLKKIINNKNQNIQPQTPAPSAPPTSAQPEPVKPSNVHMDLLNRALRKGQIDKRYYDDLNSRLNSEDEEEARGAAEEIDKLVDGNISIQSEPAKAEPVQSTSQSLPQPAKPEDNSPIQFSFTRPPTIGKKWEQLNPVEKEAWNHYGGGISTRRHRVSGIAEDEKALTLRLPWILRLGDPRREDYQNAIIHKKNNVGADKERKSPFWAHLIRMGRIETDKDPIQSEADLNMRVSDIKKKIEERVKKEPAVAPSPLISPVLRPQDKPTLAPINPDEIVDKKLKHTADNALGKPAHNTPEVSDIAGVKEKIKTNDAKDILKGRIEKLKNDKEKQSLLKSLEDASSPEEIEKINKILQLYEDDSDF